MVLLVVGLVLLGLAAVSNYGDSYLLAARFRAFVRFPGMPAGQYYYFPIWWIVVGLPLAAFGLGLLFPLFRRAVAAPWRRLRFAVPTTIVLVLLVFTMFPWELPDTFPSETGSRMVLYLILAGTGLALFLAGAYDKLRFLDRPLERTYQWLIGLDRRTYLLLLFGFAFIVANLISVFSFGHMPRVPDSIAQFFQARIFATGRLFLDSPRFPDFFDLFHIINHGQWYSQYPFLHSLLLAPGVLIGMPWIINPLLGALTVPAIYLLGREVYDERTGRLAGVLACFTPFIFNMSAEFMNHSSALLFTTLSLLFYFRVLRQGRWRQALFAGAFLGLVVNVRPYTAFGVALPFAAYGLYRAVKNPKRLVPRFGLMALGLAAVSSLTFAYNWLTNGDPLLFGYVVKWGAGHGIGFGKSGWGMIHTPFRGLVNTGNRLTLVNKFLYEWPIPSLVPILLLFGAGTKDKRDWLLLLGFVSLTAVHFFYWYHDASFGSRFLYESAACLVILTVLGGMRLKEFLNRNCRLDVSDRAASHFVGRTLVVLLLVMLAVGLPPRLAEFRSYGLVDTRVVQNVRRAGLRNALVFCRRLGNGFSANALTLDGDVVYASDYGILNSALTIAYPSRQYYYANKDTLRPLQALAYPRSRLRRVLEEMDAFLAQGPVGPGGQAGYRTIIRPFNDIRPAGFDTAGPAPGWDEWPRLTDFREVSREIFTSRHVLDDYLPTLACWMLNDKREHIGVFSFMDDLESFIVADYKFTLLMVTEEGTGTVYDIRRVTGEEKRVPKEPGPVPIR